MKVLLEVSATRRPGSDRGIGRYVAQVRKAIGENGLELAEMSSPRSGTGRLSEFADLAQRSGSMLSRSFDVFHAPTAYYSGGDLRGRPAVVSILDLIPLEMSSHRKTGLKASFFHRLAARADAIMTLSEHSAGRIVERLGVPRNRIVVAPLPAAPVFVPGAGERKRHGRREALMMLDLRTPDPRKRSNWLPEIARRLSARGVGVRLVGGGTEALGLANVTSLGRLSDEAWAAELRAATVFLYTSAYEGQGMPLLEALASGTPVVCMMNSALPEVVGAAGVLVPEGETVDSLEGLATGVEKVIEDAAFRERLRAECVRRAVLFSAERFSGALAFAYASAMGARR